MALFYLFLEKKSENTNSPLESRLQDNPLKPNDLYIGRTALLTSRRCILYIYSTNIRTEYFKNAAHSTFFFFLQNALYFIMIPF